MTIHTNNNSLNYIIDQTFTKVCRLFIFSFERIRENNKTKDHRGSFSNHYLPKVEIKDFNVLIDVKRFFDLPVKTIKKHIRKIMRCAEIMTMYLVIYWVFLVFKTITD